MLMLLYEVTKYSLFSCLSSTGCDTWASPSSLPTALQPLLSHGGITTAISVLPRNTGGKKTLKDKNDSLEITSHYHHPPSQPFIPFHFHSCLSPQSLLSICKSFLQRSFPAMAWGVTASPDIFTRLLSLRINSSPCPASLTPAPGSIVPQDACQHDARLREFQPFSWTVQ